ncbi:MAG: PP2C family serine/threonine-protein phosphatase [Acidobacteriota bacterium]
MARFSLEVGFSTDVGRQRRRNEDDCTVYVPYPGEANPSQLAGMLLVADGMGGERAGDRASQLTTRRLRHWFATGMYRSWPEFTGPNPLETVVRHAIQRISREIFEVGQNDAGARGLGSTVVLTLLAGSRMVLAHVGDSRAYRIRGDRIEQLTTDHSWVQRQVDAGVLAAEAARTHPQRNILTRSLGDSLPPEVDVSSVEVHDGDVFVLCSDGLTGGLEDHELLALVRRGSGAQALAEILVREANEQDGSDNITAVVGRCHREDSEARQSFEDAATEFLDAAPRRREPEDDTVPLSPVERATLAASTAGRPEPADDGADDARPTIDWRTWLTAALLAIALGLLALHLAQQSHADMEQSVTTVTHAPSGTDARSR